MKMKKLLRCLVVFLASSVTTIAADLTVYHIGNSLTRNLPLERLKTLFAASGIDYDYGLQLGPGHRLHQHLVKRNHAGAPGTGKYNTLAKFGEYDQAFTRHRFDAIVLQPYLAELDSAPVSTDHPPYFIAGDLQAASALIDYARGRTKPGAGRWDLDHPNNGHNASERFFIYAIWPGIPSILEQDGEKTFARYYARPYRGGLAPTADFFAQLVKRLNDQHRDLAFPVRIIPVGEVMARLDSQIRAGKLPGIAAFFERHQPYYIKARRNNPTPSAFDPDRFDPQAGVLNFYADGIHLNDQPHNGPDSGTIGAYVAALTHFATLSGQTPVGLTAAPYEMFDSVRDADLIRSLQETVWSVVAGHPLTGIKAPLPSASRNVR